MYCAIIGDIVDSKKINKREEVQKKLKSLLDKLSDKYKEDIASKFTITLGDEFQVLLINPGHIIEIIDQIKTEMYPIEFRFGIGLGDIHTPVNKELAIGSDGPAYHIARSCINGIKESDSKYEQIKSDIKIASANTRNEKAMNLVNASFAQSYYTEKNWSDKHREIVLLMMEQDISQRELAKELGITQSGVNRRINSSGYLIYDHLKTCVKDVINDVWEDVTHE